MRGVGEKERESGRGERRAGRREKRERGRERGEQMNHTHTILFSHESTVSVYSSKNLYRFSLKRVTGSRLVGGFDHFPEKGSGRLANLGHGEEKRETQMKNKGGERFV